MKGLPFLFLLTFFLSGCATAPEWIKKEGKGPVMLAWHKGAELPGFVEKGICHVFSRDENENDLVFFGEQVVKCLDGNLAEGRSTSVVPVKKIMAYFADRTTVIRRYVDINGLGDRRDRDSLEETGGFFFWRDGICRINFNGYGRKVGHETKHCFDGFFHDNNWNWYPRKPENNYPAAGAAGFFFSV